MAMGPAWQPSVGSHASTLGQGLGLRGGSGGGKCHRELGRPTVKTTGGGGAGLTAFTSGSGGWKDKSRWGRSGGASLLFLTVFSRWRRQGCSLGSLL